MLGSNHFGQLGHSRDDHNAPSDDTQPTGQSIGQSVGQSAGASVINHAGGGVCYRVSRLQRHFVTHVACGDSFTVAATKRMSQSVCLLV